MGCVFSKPSEGASTKERRQGLLVQQNEFINNNEHQGIKSQKDGPNEPSRHSPPASRPQSLSGNLHPELDGIESLSELRWSTKWTSFKTWLAAQEAEGEDEEGRPLSLERYATFSELFTSLETRHAKQPGTQAVREAFLNIVNHEEKFFGKYRCLQCVDSGLREAIRDEAKKVKAGTIPQSIDLLFKVNQEVEDKKLSNLLASYQKHVTCIIIY